MAPVRFAELQATVDSDWRASGVGGNGIGPIPIQIDGEREGDRGGSGGCRCLGFAGWGDKEREWGPTWAGLVGPMASWAAVQQGRAGSLVFLFIYLLFCFKRF